MSDAPDRDAFHAPDLRIVELEGCMNTMQEQYAGALDRFRADFAGLKEDMAKRDVASLWRLVVLLAIGFGISTTILGLVLG